MKKIIDEICTGECGICDFSCEEYWRHAPYKRREVVYISGKVTGEAMEEVRKKFADAQRQLELKDYSVINPLAVVAKHVSDPFNVSWNVAMRLCISAMMQADALYMLKNWRFSKGAVIEHELAERLGIRIMYED